MRSGWVCLARRWMAGAVMLAVLLGAGRSALAVEYFVGVTGDDSRDGRTPESAFATVQRGVDALRPGDTLTIGPGEYREAVFRSGLGSADADTVIRAAIPGTVFLRGDVAAPEFRKAEGYRNVYRADFAGPAQALWEADTLAVLEQVPSVGELEFLPGGMHYDADGKVLYLSTSDMQPPGSHRYTVSVRDANGFWLKNPQRVTIDGLAVGGFQNRDLPPRDPDGNSALDGARWGIRLDGASRCVVRRCAAFFNGIGIGLRSTEQSGGNVIEECEAFANHSRFTQEGANILVLNSNRDTIRRSLAYIGRLNGIRVYGTAYGPALIEDCISWGHAGNNLTMKGGNLPELAALRGSVGLGKNHVPNIASSLLGSRIRAEDGADALRDSILLSAERAVDFDREFADAENFDFRLQPGSRFRKSGPEGSDRGPFPYQENIFYVGPQGDDGGAGLSADAPWKTLAHAVSRLKAGDTLYLLPGTYAAPGPLALPGRPGLPIRLLGRGGVDAVIEGSFVIAGSTHIVLERLQFLSPVRTDRAAAVTFANCTFRGGGEGLALEATSAARIEHCAFSGSAGTGLRVGAGCSEIFLSSNIFDNAAGTGISVAAEDAVSYSDDNAFRNADSAWQIGTRVLGLPDVPAQHERRSVAAVPELAADGGRILCRLAPGFPAGARLGKPFGPFRPPSDLVFRLSDPEVHSVTDTTANLEWHSSLPGLFELAWGKTPELGNIERCEGVGFTTFSLTDLQPDTEYSFQIRRVIPDASLADQGLSVRAPGPARTATFRTAARASAPRTLHVSVDGDDRKDGLSSGSAWKTVSHAAAEARPGDTVLIGPGRYLERVRIRATGTPSAPITFKSAPGARAILDGDGRKLSSAFVIQNKNQIHFDGLTFTQYVNHGHDSSFWLLSRTGIFKIIGSDGIRITRCFMDGRGLGYAPWFVAAFQSNDLFVSNCVIVNPFNALSITDCNRAVIENSVFIRPMIAVGHLFSAPDQTITFRNNIVTDNLPVKEGVRIFDLARLSTLADENTCYWLRQPGDGRVVYSGTLEDGGPARTFTLGEYQKLFPRARALTADPGFAGLAGTAPISGRNFKAANFDLLAAKDFPLDFAALFATHPDVVARGIGLDPAKFADLPALPAPLAVSDE